MKSIRLSLIVYFLVLVTGALSAVSWFSYRTTAQALRDQQRDSQKMIEQQTETRIKLSKAGLDRTILRQAQRLAGRSLVTVHYEAAFLASAIGASAMPEGMFSFGIWQPYSGPAKSPIPDTFPNGKMVYVPLAIVPEKRFFASELGRLYPRQTHIESSEAIVVNADTDGHPQEYFQTYGSNGKPWQRSESMGDHWFSLKVEFREKAQPFDEYFEDEEIKPGVKIRLVTLKLPRAGGFGPRPGGGTKGKGGPPPPPPGNQPRPVETVFIQYAADLAPLQEKIQSLQNERDELLANLETTISSDLRQLRSRMLWIALATLGALWLGGFLVIRMGLAPLAKMSEAVSQVSPQNFHLPLDPDNLPNELQPIAERLVEVLDHLQKAFAREKQAAADISHELRTPLAALMTTLEVALKKPRRPEEYQEILDECRACGQHMYQLVERLLTLARLDAGADQYRPEPVDVTEIALQCADIIRPLARARGLSLRLQLPDAIVTETDPNKVREVLTNFLHNAVEYNKPNGSINLSVEQVNGHVRFEVRDTGIGIKPDILAHIFERFYRADPSRHAETPHAGLGLAIVKSYVDLMKGTIRVESSEEGTSFVVELPYVASIHDLSTAVQTTPVLAEQL